MENLDKCIRMIIDSGFPELSKTLITSSYSKMDYAYFEFSRNSRFSYHINVDKPLRKKKTEIIIGGLAHELSHISKEIKMNLIVSSIDGFLYNKFDWYEKLDERNTDLLAVSRGFGKELLEFLKYADSKRKKYRSEDGLTVKVLEFILKNNS